MPFDMKHMIAMMKEVDGSDEDWIAEMHGVVSGLLIDHIDKLERRIEALESDANQFYRRHDHLEQNQRPIEGTGEAL